MEWVTIQLAMFIGGFAIAILLAIPCGRLFRINVSNEGRYAHLDGLRAVAALAVVTCHINQSVVAFFHFSEPPLNGNRFGVLGVQMFFGLTAFLFTSRAIEGKLNPSNFYVSRLKRIMPLYIVAATATLCIALRTFPFPVSSNLFSEIVDLYSFAFVSFPMVTINSQSVMPIIGVAWTLSYEWMFYLLLVPTYYIINSSPRSFILVVLTACILAIRDFFYYDTAVWTFFIVGAFAAIVKPYIPRITGLPQIALIATIPISVILVALKPGSAFSFYNLVLSAEIFLIVLFCEPEVLNLSALQTLGRISYSVYLLQYIVLYQIANYAFAHGILNANPVIKFVTCYLVVAVLIPLSCVTYKWIELPFLSPGHNKRRVEPSGSGPAVYSGDADDAGHVLTRRI